MNEVIRLFEERFPDRNLPLQSTINCLAELESEIRQIACMNESLALV